MRNFLGKAGAASERQSTEFLRLGWWNNSKTHEIVVRASYFGITPAYP
jgi:hypothetical protein